MILNLHVFWCGKKVYFTASVAKSFSRVKSFGMHTGGLLEIFIAKYCTYNFCCWIEWGYIVLDLSVCIPACRLQPVVLYKVQCIWYAYCLGQALSKDICVNLLVTLTQMICLVHTDENYEVQARKLTLFQRLWVKWIFSFFVFGYTTYTVC